MTLAPNLASEKFQTLNMYTGLALLAPNACAGLPNRPRSKPGLTGITGAWKQEINFSPTQ